MAKGDPQTLEYGDSLMIEWDVVEEVIDDADNVTSSTPFDMTGFVGSAYHLSRNKLVALPDIVVTIPAIGKITAKIPPGKEATDVAMIEILSLRVRVEKQADGLAHTVDFRDIKRV